MKKRVAKIFSLCLAAVLCATAFTFSAAAEQDPVGYMTGDVDNNGEINTLDSLAILKHVAQLEKLTDAQMLPADADEDGSVNTADALKILKAIAKLEAFDCFAKTASVFANNMVLQRDEQVPVWGYSTAGKIVKVSFAGQEKQAVTGTDGKWMVYLDAMSANSEAQDMTITCSGEKVIKNVLVGEVWFAGGQSNMAFVIGALGDATLKSNILNDCDYPLIRIFTQGENTSSTPQKFNLSSRWTASTKTTVSTFSVMAYLLARDLHKELNIPVGIITAAHGGTNIESHINNQVLADSGLDVIYGGASTFEKNVYNQMLAPLFPFKVKGAIWYQGENNSAPEMAAVNYPQYLKLYVEQLRTGFENSDMAFVQVQLPSCGSPYDFTDMRYYQMAGDDLIDGVYTVPAYDTGYVNDIHPSDKAPIAQRIKSTVFNKVYNKTDYTCTYPKADSFTPQEDGSVIVSFKQNINLTVTQEQANTLYACDKNGIYYQAKAEVVDNTKLKITCDKFEGKIYGVKYASEAVVKTAHIVTSTGSDPIMPFRWEDLPPVEDATKLLKPDYDYKMITTYDKYPSTYKFTYNDGFTGWPSTDYPIHTLGLSENGGVGGSKALSVTLNEKIGPSYFVMNTKPVYGDNTGSRRATEMWFHINANGAKIDSLYLGARCGGLYGTQYTTASQTGIEGREIYLIKDNDDTITSMTLNSDGKIDLPADFSGYIRIPTKYLVDESAKHNPIDTGKIDTFVFGFVAEDSQKDKTVLIDNVMLYGPALQNATGKITDIVNKK